MSPDSDRDVAMHEGFPRVSGDEPANFAELKQLIEFSPRERG